MRKTAIIVGLIGGLSTVGTLIAQQRAPNDPIANVAQIAVVRTYNVKDFPVWSKNGEKFDASILIALLQSRVIPGQWNDENKIVPFANERSLVIVTTQDAHKAIENVLEELRGNP
ncbi:MAG: hypothetical protein IT422_17470 [Pirellulaceae bacterium]|jgi:hypothetical protein|nr:hypothetical protein [Pirellulaceae bacterium]